MKLNLHFEQKDGRKSLSTIIINMFLNSQVNNFSILNFWAHNPFSSLLITSKSRAFFLLKYGISNFRLRLAPKLIYYISDVGLHLYFTVITAVQIPGNQIPIICVWPLPGLNYNHSIWTSEHIFDTRLYFLWCLKQLGRNFWI